MNYNKNILIIPLLIVLVFFVNTNDFLYAQKNKKKVVNKSKAISKQKKSKTKSTKHKHNSNNSIQKNKEELNNISKEINNTRKKINQLQKTEKSTLQTLNTYQKHTHQVKKYIQVLEGEINILQDTLEKVNYSYSVMNSRLNDLQLNYQKLSRNILLKGQASTSELFFLNNNKNSEISKEIYFKLITKQLNEYAKEMNHIKDSLAIKSNILQGISEQQLHLKNIKENEKKQLQKTIQGKQIVLNTIRKDKSNLIKQLAEKENSAKKLKSIIANLVQQELKKQATQKTSKTKSEKNKVKQSTSNNNNTNNLAHNTEQKTERIPSKVNGFVWPSSKHSIKRGFGNYTNSETGATHNNPGIDISLNSGSSVKASANGVVSLIHWLPGYGSLIIINHGNGYRTVYANLSELYVRKGESVEQGAVIGRSGESVDGEYLHFELWNGNHRLNPASYLR